MTDEVRQEDREAADEVFDALSERYGVPAVYRTALAFDFAAHASPLRDRIAVLEGALSVFLGYDDRFQIMVGGNPAAVEEMMDEARAALNAAGGKQDA